MSVQLPQPAAATMYSGSGPAQVTQPVRLLDTATGEVIERIPSIAREILACNNGRYVLEGEPVPASPDASDPGDGEKLPPLPKIAHLAAAVSALDVDAVRAMQARDSRANAAPIYAARLAELEPAPE